LLYNGLVIKSGGVNSFFVDLLSFFPAKALFFVFSSKKPVQKHRTLIVFQGAYQY